MTRTRLNVTVGLALLALFLTPALLPAADSATVVPFFSSQKSVATGTAISGKSTYGLGVYGYTEEGYGVMGVDAGTTQGRGYGGYFTSNTGIGVAGRSTATASGSNLYTPGVYGSSLYGTGVYGRSESTSSWPGAGVIGWGYGGPGGKFFGYNNIIEGWEDFYGNNTTLYMRFKVNYLGNVYADGSYLSPAADVAERIDASEVLEQGSVVEIDPDNPGQFRLSRSPYSTLVAGVISTNPAIIMNNDLTDIENDEDTDDRPLLALAGQVPVRVSDENGPIAPGDLLVSSSTPGYAMRGGDDPPAGTVVGKALGGLDGGTDMIRVLVTLR